MMRLLLVALAALFLAPVSVSAQNDLAVQSAQVEDLTSVREIKRLQSALGHLAIGGRWQDMAALFTPDATLQWHGDAVSGRAAIADYLQTQQGGGVEGMPAGRMNMRLFVSPVITLGEDGQSAMGRWHEVVMTAEVGTSADWNGGTHVVRYSKGAEGWLIADMRFYSQFSGPYAPGFSHNADVLERAPYHYTPDQAGVILPQREADQPWSRQDIDRRATLLLGASRAQNLVNAFGYYLDRGRYEDVADLFADNGTVRVQGQGRWSGRNGVLQFLARYGEAGLSHGELNDRMLLMPLVDVAANGRMVLINMIEIGMTGQHGEQGFWSAASMRFMLQRGPDDVWRIRGVQRVPLMRSTYSEGWAHPLPAALPVPDGGQPAVSIVRDTGYDLTETITMPTSLSLIAPGSSETQVTLVPGALAMAEAFDGAENVSNAYGYYIDQFSWRNTAALFASDGWKELSYIGTFIGRERVLGSLIQRYGEGGPNDAFQAIHQKTQPFVSVLDDGRAMVRTRLWQINSSSSGTGSWIGGIYENQVVREDGIWRIHGMDLDYVWLGDYSGGWIGADPQSSARFGVSADVIAEFAPDAPLRGEAFAPYPRIADMGFHFDNPVSGRETAVRLEWSDGDREEE